MNKIHREEDELVDATNHDCAYRCYSKVVNNEVVTILDDMQKARVVAHVMDHVGLVIYGDDHLGAKENEQQIEIFKLWMIPNQLEELVSNNNHRKRQVKSKVYSPEAFTLQDYNSLVRVDNQRNCSDKMVGYASVFEITVLSFFYVSLDFYRVRNGLKKLTALLNA